MAQSNCLDVIKIQRMFLVLCGIWPAEKSTLFYKTKRMVVWISSLAYTVILYAEIFNNYNNYKAASEILAYLLTMMTYLGKLALFRIKKRETLEILAHLKDPMFSAYAQKLDKHMQNTIHQMMNTSIVYTTIAMAMIIALIVKPILGISDLPVDISFCEGYCVPAMYIFEIFVFVVIIINIVSFDLLGSGLMAIASAQFKILSKKIVHARDFVVVMDNTMSDDALNLVLFHCVEHHIKIIKFVKSIQDIFSNIFLMQFLEGILCICNIGFQLAHVSPNNLQFYVMLGYLFGKLQQIGLYCWFGNEIIVQSSQIGCSCFQTQWYECGPKVRKTLYLIMERGKRPTVLTAGKFSNLSLTSFVGLLHTSYSYFALMQRLYKNSQDKN